MWRQIRSLVIKEILAVWRDKKSRIALVAPPIIQLLILSHAATLEVKNISIGIYNQDSGWYSQELVKRIEGSPYFSHVYKLHSNAEITQKINQQNVILSMQMQPDFSRNISQGKTGKVQIILDGRKANASQIVFGYVNRMINTFNADILTLKGITNQPRVDVVSRSWFNPNLDYIFYNVPCLVAILSMLLALNVTAQAVAREREMGTLDQLLVSPLQPWQFLLGKTLPAMLIGIVESTFIMLLAMILFGVEFRGSIALFYFSMVVFITAIVGVGLFISSLAQTQQQANLGVFMFMVPTMLLSGYSTPIENMPTWLQPVTQLMPIKHFFIIVKGVFLKSMGAGEVLMHTWPMALIALFTLSFSVWSVNRRLG